MDTETQDQAEGVAPLQRTATFTPPSDPSKYIRTYAKDVAVLTNTPAPTVAPAPTPTAPAPGTTTEIDGVAMREYDASPVDHSDAPASPKEFKQEITTLHESDSDDIFTKGTGKEKREDILARLRAQISTKPEKFGSGLSPSISQIPVPVVAPIKVVPEQVFAAPLPTAPITEVAPEPTVQETIAPAAGLLPVSPTPPPPPAPRAPIPPSIPVEHPVLPPEITMRIGAPTFESAPDPVLSIPLVKKEEFVAPTAPIVPEAPIVVPTPTNAPIVPEVPVMPPVTPKGPSPLHTFSSDFADRIDDQKSSTFSVLAAQSDAGQTPRSLPQTRRRNIFPLVAGIAMVVIGTGAIAAAYIYSRNSGDTTVIIAGVPSLVTFDESIPVTGTGTALMQEIRDASQGTTVSGNVVVTYLTTPESSAALPGSQLIRALMVPAPDILLRNINDSSTVGFIRAGNESAPFILLSVSSYERTFAGMLAWEATIGKDLGIFYPTHTDSLPPSSATSTASSTPRIVVPANPQFTDAVVSNYDVRVLRDGAGRSLLLYGYRGKDMLIIARDEVAFTALVNRLASGGH